MFLITLSDKRGGYSWRTRMLRDENQDAEVASRTSITLATLMPVDRGREPGMVASGLLEQGLVNDFKAVDL